MKYLIPVLKLLSFVMICMLSWLNGYCQTFFNRYDTIGFSHSNCIKITTDNHYIIAGAAFSTSTLQDGAFLKTDSVGNIVWVYKYGTPLFDDILTMELLNDSTIISFGIKNSTSPNYSSLWKLKVSTNGDTIQTSDISFGNGMNWPSSSCKTTDNGIALAGTTNSFVNGSKDGFLIKFDSLGNEQWRYTYGKNYDEFIYGLCQTADSGFILTGTSDTLLNGSACLIFIKVDKSGALEFINYLSYNHSTQGVNVIKTDYNQYINLSTTYSFTNGYKIHCTVLDSIFNVINFREFNLSSEDVAVSIKKLSSNKYVICSSVFNANSQNYNVSLLCINENLDSLWHKEFSQASNSRDIAAAMEINQKGVIMVTGESDINSGAAFILRVDSSIINRAELVETLESFMIFPNPCDNYLNILITTPFYINLSSINIYNSFGQTVFNYKIRKEVNKYQIDTSSLPSGIYFISIPESNLSNFKFIRL